MGQPTSQHMAAVASRLITAGEYEGAFRLIQKMDLSSVGTPRFLVDISQQLSILGFPEHALRYLDVAVARGFKGEAVNYLRGTYLRHLGRFEEAAEEFERSIATNPDLAIAHRALANLDIATGRDVRIDRIRKSLARDAITNSDRAHLNYGLFRELDAVDDTTSAWQALEEGARAKRLTVDYDAGTESALFDQLVAACRPAFAAQQESSGAEHIPIFVLGMPRTGTTLVERILGGHPQVTLCGELNDFRQQFKWVTDHQCTGFIDSTGVARLPDTDLSELGKRYLDHVVWRAPATRFFSDKNPGNWILAGLILKALPQARIIHLRRNPMDTCFSNLKELFTSGFYPYSYGQEDLAAHYRNYTRLMAQWHDIVPGRILDVRYEDLVSDPEPEARRLMEYCGLGFLPSQVQIEANATPVSTASAVQVRQAIHDRNVGGWKRYASRLAPLERLLADG